MPTFLGIGVPRGGTTWLHNLLYDHAHVYVPRRRKEIHYYDWYYERGVEWYESFFPSHRDGQEFHAIGEITPHYLYGRECPRRIAETPSVTKLILTLRNPIDRAYSHYCFHVRIKKFKGPFAHFLSYRPEMIQWGLYSQHLKRYLKYFDSTQILTLIYEEATTDVQRTKEVLARFLGVKVDGFADDAGTNTVNVSYIPKARTAYAIAIRAAFRLRRWDLDWVINLARKLGIRQVFGNLGSPPAMPREIRTYLAKVYEEEIAEMESLLQRELPSWTRSG